MELLFNIDNYEEKMRLALELIVWSFWLVLGWYMKS